MRNALLGATGAVGRALGELLAEAGDSFRVVGRSEAKLREQFGKYGARVDVHAADLADPEAALGALRGVETAFYLVGVPYTNFELHPKLTGVALEAARQAGVRRFVHVSTVYPYGRPTTPRVDESHPREPHTFKGKMRKAQEDLVLAADDPNGDRGGMRTVIVRPPDFYGPGAEQSYVHGVFEAARKGERAKVVGPVDTPHQFIFVPDLARTLLAVAAEPATFGQAWNVGPAGDITTRRFADLVFAEAGAGKTRLMPAGGLALRLVGLFDPFMREVVEMHYLWKTPVLLDDAALDAALPGGLPPKTSYEDGIRQTLAAPHA